MRIDFNVIKKIIICSLVVFAMHGCSSKGVQSVTGEPVTNVFETFKRGEARLNCSGSCSGAWGASRREFKDFYEQGLWVDLVNKVSSVGFGSDQTYFYLGRAAEGLGYYPAARQYYNLAIVSFKCDGLFNNCDGLVFPRDIVAGLNRLPNSNEAPMINGKSVLSSFQGEAAARNNETETHMDLGETEIPPISVAQWSSIVNINNEEKSTDWIAIKSADIAGQGTKALKGGKRKQGLELSLRSAVLTSYYLGFYRSTESEKINTLKAAHEEQKKVLVEAGVPSSIFDASLKNLGKALPSEEIKVSIVEETKKLKVRKASNSEVVLLNRATKLRLIDPDSAKFGDHIIVGEESACVMVNAKNRMGGYSGVSAIYLEKLDGSWYSIRNMGELGTCLASIKMMKSK